MSEMNKTVGNQVLLTSDDVRHWQEELQKAESAKAQAEGRIVELHKKLEAAALLSGASFPLPAITGDEGEDGQESMGDAAKRLLATFSRPIQHHELQTELRKIQRFREMLDKNAGAYYYTIIQRLAKRGDIKKVGKKIRLIHKNEAPPEGNPESAQ